MRQNFDHSFIHGIQIATPCHESWDKMTGDERSRFCHACKLNVYNFSEMTTAEIEELVQKKEGRTCVRFYRRRDGKILTKDCPKGLEAVRLRMFTVAAAAVAMVSGAVIFVMRAMQPNEPDRVTVIHEVKRLAEEARQNAVPKGEAIMGGAPAAFDYNDHKTGQLKVRGN